MELLTIAGKEKLKASFYILKNKTINPIIKRRLMTGHNHRDQPAGAKPGREPASLVPHPVDLLDYIEESGSFGCEVHIQLEPNS